MGMCCRQSDSHPRRFVGPRQKSGSSGKRVASRAPELGLATSTDSSDVKDKPAHEAATGPVTATHRLANQIADCFKQTEEYRELAKQFKQVAAQKGEDAAQSNHAKGLDLHELWCA